MQARHECRYDGRCTKALQSICDYKHSSKQTQWERDILDKAIKAAKVANEDEGEMEQVDNDDKSVSEGNSVLEAIGAGKYLRDDTDVDSQNPSSSTEATSTSSRKDAERSDHNNRDSYRRGDKSNHRSNYNRDNGSNRGSRGGYSSYNRNYSRSKGSNHGSRGGHNNYNRNNGSSGNRGGHGNYSRNNGNNHGSRGDHNRKNDRDNRDDRNREKRSRDEGRQASRDGKETQDKRSKDESTTSQTYDKDESDTTKRMIQFNEIEEEAQDKRHWARINAAQQDIKAAQREIEIKTEALNKLIAEDEATERSNRTSADSLGETWSQKTSDMGGARADHAKEEQSPDKNGAKSRRSGCSMRSAREEEANWNIKLA